MQPTDVRDAALSAVHRSKSYLSKQVDERSTHIGRRCGSMARNLRTIHRQLGRRGAPAVLVAPLNHGAASAEQFGEYLRGADSDRLIADFEALARRRQWEFASVAFVVGLAAGRILKRSRARLRATGVAAPAAFGAAAGCDDALDDPLHDGSTDIGRAQGGENHDAT